MEPTLMVRRIFLASAMLTLAVWSTGLWADNGNKLKTVYDLYAGYKAKAFPMVTDITPKAAMALLNVGRVVFVDTREPAEMQVSMLPGAITRDDFLAQPTAYAGSTPIVYCTISYRSGLFARDMALKGITVLNLAGGLLAWVLEGGTVYDAAGETRRIHVYGDKWNYAPEDYTAVTFGFLYRLIN